MPRMRRDSVILLSVLVGAVFLLYMIISPASSTTDFRRTTLSSLALKDHYARRGRTFTSDADLLAETNDRLAAVLAQHDQSVMAAENVHEIPSAVGADTAADPVAEHARKTYDEVSVAGRKSMPKPVAPGKESASAKPRYPSSLAAANDDDDGDASTGARVQKVVDAGLEAAREELQQIFKRSPIIIFSKSRCPYSKRAKKLLLDTYSILPAPHVVELDLLTEPASSSALESPSTETLGRKLQDLLTEITGRRTVPNIMVNMKSIGGSDDVMKMDSEGVLADEIRRLAGKRIAEVKKLDL